MIDFCKTSSTSTDHTISSSSLSTSYHLLVTFYTVKYTESIKPPQSLFNVILFCENPVSYPYYQCCGTVYPSVCCTLLVHQTT